MVKFFCILLHTSGNIQKQVTCTGTWKSKTDKKVCFFSIWERIQRFSILQSNLVILLQRNHWVS